MEASPCPNCAYVVSNYAKQCPNCGRDLTAKSEGASAPRDDHDK
jgi:RNA polymerase subunit RPABC4/transcription elongation factor Spt4